MSDDPTVLVIGARRYGKTLAMEQLRRGLEKAAALENHRLLGEKIAVWVDECPDLDTLHQKVIETGLLEPPQLVEPMVPNRHARRKTYSRLRRGERR